MIRYFKLFLLLLIVLVYLASTQQIAKKKIKQSQPQINTLLSEDLNNNSSGEQVALLQSVLRTDPSLYGGEVSGFFTLTTSDAVKRFQKKYLLPPTGEIDLITRLKFNEVFGVNKSMTDYMNNKNRENKKWGKAEKVEGTRYGWSMKIENDLNMSTSQEIFDALNKYRMKKNRVKLIWNKNLAAFAQQRAQDLTAIGDVDEHRGFRDYTRNPANREQLGFMRLGENTSCGYRMTGTHMIEWIFAGDTPHDENQLSRRWTNVGVGVSGTCVSLVFGNK